MLQKKREKKRLKKLKLSNRPITSDTEALNRELLLKKKKELPKEKP